MTDYGIEEKIRDRAEDLIEIWRQHGALITQELIDEAFNQAEVDILDSHLEQSRNNLPYRH